MADNRPIGVFDSGVGGISVLRELVKIMPNENFIYFGDSKNAPYGVKSFEEVRALTMATADYLIQSDCKCLVIACNTATAAAVRYMRSVYMGVPVVGIEPALKPAVLATEGGLILVLATSVTLHEEKFHKLMGRYEKMADIRTLACPGIVEFVEKGIIDGPELNSYLKELLADYLDNPPDAIVLGCTHYPFVRAAINDVMNGKSLIFDGGEGTARQTKRLVKLNEIGADANQVGTVTIYNSNPQMISLSEKLLSYSR